MAARRYELTDAQWDRIKDLIPRAKTGRPPKDNRMMLNAMLWLARSGAAWADIPSRFGPHQTVYSRFCKWRDDGTLLRIFQELNADAEYENLCVDSTSIKAHPQRKLCGYFYVQIFKFSPFLLTNPLPSAIMHRRGE